MADEALAVAARVAIAAHPDGAEAGPSALLAAIKEASPEFADVGIQKFKRVLTKVRAALKEEEQAMIEASKCKVGSTDNCPGKHGLKRFLTNHASYCCDTCRCYLPIGAPMWGCRECDWDVCEGRCRRAGSTLPEMRVELASLEGQVEVLNTEAPADLKTRLALLESEVHKLEKRLDNATVQDLIKASIVRLTDEEVRADKKALIAGCEALLAKIEAIFERLKQGETDGAAAAAEATS